MSDTPLPPLPPPLPAVQPQVQHTDTPRTAARKRQRQAEYLRRTFAKGKVGGRIKMTWRLVDALDDDRATARWISWSGTIVTLLREEDDDDAASGSVRWDMTCEELEQQLAAWPPAVVLQHPTWVFEVQEVTVTDPVRTKPVLRLAPLHQDASARPEPFPRQEHVPRHEPVFRQDPAPRQEPEQVDEPWDMPRRRQRSPSPPSPESLSSMTELDERKYDKETGCRAPMRDLVRGLRVPEFIDQTSAPWYPHVWVNSVAWTLAVRQKMLDFSCSIKSWRIKQDMDLDISLLSELIERRANTGGVCSLQHHRNAFSLVARIITNMMLTSPMAGLSAAEGFYQTFSRMLQVGRVDFDHLIMSKLGGSTATTTVATAPAPAQAPSESKLMSDSAEFWRNQAESFQRQALNQGSRDRGSFRGGHHENHRAPKNGRRRRN